MDGDDALVRRIVDAAAMPALLARDGATALLEACDAQAAALFVQATSGQIHFSARRGATPRVPARSPRLPSGIEWSAGMIVTEPIGRAPGGRRFAALLRPAR